jgi:hypothetical protein
MIFLRLGLGRFTTKLVSSLIKSTTLVPSVINIQSVQKRFKNSSKPLIRFKKEKSSKNHRKAYKLKNNKSAISRFIVVKGGYKRLLCGRSHFRRKLRSKKDMKVRVLVNKQQKRHLNKLIPYHKKKYFK